MRPTKLIISAFGSYADKTVIDLDKLGEKGLYLITGDTGAGKTTIFDAVTFALFGEPSGGNRDTGMFRSKYADPETPTEVELTFLYRGEEYYIKRNPDYERPKKRGEGITKTAADAELKYPDGRIVTKVKDVNRAVTQILGVEREQFSQIAMIAQGEFLKLLLADTKTRKEIFRKLFHTENYEKLQNKLKEEFKAQEDLLEKSKDGLNFSIGSIICDSERDSVLAQNVTAAKFGQLTVTAAESEIIPRLAALIASDKAEAEENTAKKSDTENKLKELASLLDKADKYQKDKEALSVINVNLEASRNMLIELSEVCEKSKSDKEKAGAQLTEQKPRLEKLLEVLREIEKEKSALDSTDKAIAECKAEIEGSKEKSQKYEDEIKACKTEMEKLQNAEVEREKIGNRKTESDRLLESVKKLQREYSDYAKLLSDLEKAQSDYLDRSAKAEAAKNEFDKMQKAYLDEQAGILAEELAEGAPCPVCGSVTHPILAKKSENAPDKATLDKYKERSEELGKKAVEASERSGSLKALAGEKESSIRKNAVELLGAEISIEDIPAKTEGKAKEFGENSERLQSELIEAEKNIKRKSELNGKTETLSKDMEKVI
ncbi:MAG: SMC family ATPase, partial [Oscillospiraceae bacterium]|nr:SMC family ATPase [Oscillospiraceae bacterium]